VSLPPVGARTVLVDAARLSKWIDGFADRHGALTSQLLSVEAADDHVRLVGADEAQAWIEVPFPPLAVQGGRLLTSLSVQANAPRRVGVLLVRRGGYAAGVFAGRELVASKVGSAYVQGTTKAGGWSQQRYARRRDNQARAAFAEAADVAVRVLLPEREALASLVLGGDRPACEAVLSDPRLGALATLPRGRFLAVGDPRLRVLKATPDQFLSVRISLLP
jgi:hypothetical protein